MGRQGFLCVPPHPAHASNGADNVGFAVYFSTLVFLVITIVVVAKAPTYNDNKFVWATYTNEIGWSSSFVVVMTGLVNPSCASSALPAFVKHSLPCNRADLYAGLDGAIHLVEEVKRPEKAVPLALLSTVGMGFVTGMAISVTLIYCVQDLNAALASELPFLEIIVQATGSKACGTVLMVAFLLCLFVSANSVHQSTSRLMCVNLSASLESLKLTWAFTAGPSHATTASPSPTSSPTFTRTSAFRSSLSSFPAWA